MNDLKLTRRRILAAGSATVASIAAGGLLAACGEADDDLNDNGGQGGPGDPTSTPEPEPTATDAPAEPIFDPDGDAAVFKVEYEGGFVAPEDLVRRRPIVSLFGDGNLIYPGPIPEIFPPPAAPHLLVTQLSELGLAAVGRKVLETGLFEDGDLDLNASDMLITDAAHTVFTVRLAGQAPVRVSVYALEFDQDEDILPEEKAEARRKLRELLRYVTTAPTGFPTDHIAAAEAQYEPERLELIVYPWDEVEYDFEVEPQAKAWPFDAAPEAMTEPYTYPGHDARWVELAGDEVQTMLAALKDANMLTRWEHDGESVYMINRALLPGEEAGVSPFRSDGSPEPEPDIEHPPGADEAVLRYELSGGFVPLEYLVTNMPVVALYGDGRVFSQGAQILIYPPPALPAINLQQITPEGIQMILQEAEASGSLAGNQTWDEAAGFVADAHTGTLTLHAAGETHVVRVYAPGMFDIGDMVSEEEAAFREKFDAFISKLTALDQWLPEDVFVAVPDEIPYDRLQVVAQPAGDAPKPEDVEPDEQDWPLETPLSEHGEPHSLITMGRCFVLEGQEFADVMSLLHDATTLTRWNSAGAQYVLYLRPLLPDEEGCQDPLQ